VSAVSLPAPAAVDAAPRPSGVRPTRGATAARFVAVLLLAAVWVFPLYWMAVTAVSPADAVREGRVPLVPTSPTLDGVRTAFTEYSVGPWILSSFAIATVAVALSVVLSLLAGYVLAKQEFPGKALVSLFVVATLMIPAEVVLIPQFDLIARIGWVNSFWAVIVPRAAEAFGVFLTRQFLLTLPDEMLEAARLDGAGELRILWSVVLPLCRPLIAVLVVVTFMYRWNEFALPLVVLRDPDLYTLPVGLAFLQGQYATDYPALMSGALLSSLPVLLLFVLAQRSFVSGLARTGLK
jgi:multiple sugar transport system permease protein/alpha-1,4-digalacturonate transport system permease protein